MIKILGKEIKVESVDRKRLWCKCPRHPDKNPSLEIQRAGDYIGKYWCWSCGLSGRIPQEYIHDYITTLKTTELKLDRYHSASEVLGAWPIRLNIEGIGLRAYGCKVSDNRTLLTPFYKYGKISGVQERFSNGKKKNFSGSTLGLFAPYTLSAISNEVVIICEGFSDTAMVHDLGFEAVGRHSAESSIDDLYWTLNQSTTNFPKFLVLADNDDAGIKGAKNVEMSLTCKGKYGMIRTPETGNDVCEWVREVGKDEVKSYIFNWIKELKDGERQQA